jgi:hypothetical protein
MMMSAAEEHVGRKGKCPSCQHIMVIPSADHAGPSLVAPSAPARKRPADKDDLPIAEAVDAEAIEEAGRPRRRVRRQIDDEDDEDRPRRRRREIDDDEDDDDEDRPRRRRIRRPRRRGAYADCPNCGARGDATSQSFTWWGGLLGPAIISCVTCNQCGTGYNGTHGDYNNTRILIYILVSAGIGFGFCLISFFARFALGQ